MCKYISTVFNGRGRRVAKTHIPSSLWVKGKTSAEYVNGTGPSPGE
jgi:hypothetical protein